MLVHVKSDPCGHGLSREEVVSAAPQGCGAFFVHHNQHYFCLKLHHGRWFKIDSLKMMENGQVAAQPVEDIDWMRMKHATYWTTIATDPFLHNSTGLDAPPGFTYSYLSLSLVDEQ